MISATKLFLWCSTIIVVVGSPNVIAYNVETHRAMTDRASQTSVVAGAALWNRLGLALTPETKMFPSSSALPKTARDLMQDGAEFEDNFTRPLSHFFNPINGNGLTVGLVSSPTAPNWGLENRGSIVNQAYSYRDARESYYQALTSPLPIQRDTAFGITFETLGHVVHLILDMAQPQHVRNDQPLD
jgi:hypothetical protein